MDFDIVVVDFGYFNSVGQFEYFDYFEYFEYFENNMDFGNFINCEVVVYFANTEYY